CPDGLDHLIQGRASLVGARLDSSQRGANRLGLLQASDGFVGRVAHSGGVDGQVALPPHRDSRRGEPVGNLESDPVRLVAVDPHDQLVALVLDERLPSSGHAILAGHDVSENPDQVKRSIGFLTANTGLYERLSPRELLTYFADLHGLSAERRDRRVEHLIDWLGIGDFADLRCGALSTGQRQRTSIGRALVGDPPILILDEPTLGLDVLSNRVILDFIVRERQEGKAILLCTHYLDEAESMCDRIGLLHNGALIAEGSLDELRTLSGQERLSNIFLKLVHAEELAGFGSA
ncbi:MAG: ATP-binding cassette domain-containing protein, partial [Planctomycetes bacterium]|nr:ATP-binding cassette domain-containing protein [Planctomycetota bacterium]